MRANWEIRKSRGSLPWAVWREGSLYWFTRTIDEAETQCRRWSREKRESIGIVVQGTRDD